MSLSASGGGGGYVSFRKDTCRDSNAEFACSTLPMPSGIFAPGTWYLFAFGASPVIEASPWTGTNFCGDGRVTPPEDCDTGRRFSSSSGSSGCSEKCGLVRWVVAVCGAPIGVVPSGENEWATRFGSASQSPATHPSLTPSCYRTKYPNSGYGQVVAPVAVWQGVASLALTAAPRVEYADTALALRYSPTSDCENSVEVACANDVAAGLAETLKFQVKDAGMYFISAVSSGLSQEIDVLVRLYERDAGT
jgi:hypothetical protein